MKRFLIGTAAGALLVGTGIGCTAYNGQVSVTKDASMVAGCRQVGDVAVDSKATGQEAIDELAEKARRKGANYVIIADDTAHTGAAYLCEAKSAASH